MSTDPRPLARPWAPAAVAALALSAALSGAPALADTADPSPTPAPEGTAGEAASPAQVIADALAESPVHVDPAYDGAYAPEARERVETVLAAQDDLDLYVIVVPLAEGDTWGGESEALASAVHDRMGGGERHFLVYDRRGDLEGHDLGLASGDYSNPAFYGSMAASYKTMGGQKTLPVLVEAAVEAALSDDPEGAYKDAQQAYYDRVGEPPSGVLMPARWLNPWIVGAVALALLLAAAVPLYRLAARSRPGLPGRRRAAPIAQHAAFDNADRAQLESLVERGERDLIEMGERLSEDSRVAPQHLSRALDARDAAARVHDRMARDGATLPDAVGVLVLLDLAEDALAGLRTPRRPCYANPLHGNDTRQTQWREFGGLRTIRVPLCQDCARAVRDRLRPTVLPADHEGRSVPYYEVPAERSVWAATGYGTLADDLVERILRGGLRADR